jgi:predicted LPLAT superfamily acyltransferase
MYSTTEIFTQETPRKQVVTHEAVQKYIHIYTSILSTYAIYSTFKWMRNYLDSNVLSTE